MRITERYLDLEAFQAATSTSLLIPDKFQQIRLLLRIATEKPAKMPVLATDSANVLKEAFKIAKSIKPTSKESISTILRIAELK